MTIEKKVLYFGWDTSFIKKQHKHGYFYIRIHNLICKKSNNSNNEHLLCTTELFTLLFYFRTVWGQRCLPLFYRYRNWGKEVKKLIKVTLDNQVMNPCSLASEHALTPKLNASTQNTWKVKMFEMNLGHFRFTW